MNHNNNINISIRIFMRGYIFDLESAGQNRLRVLINGEKTVIAEDTFDPYFYLIPDSLKEAEKELLSRFGDKIAGIEIIERDGRKALKVSAKTPGEVIEIGHHAKELGDARERDITYAYQYLIDKRLYASRYYDFTIEEGRPLKAKELPDEPLDLKVMAFDIEVYNPKEVPDPERDPVVCIGYTTGRKKEVLYWTQEGGSEKEIIEGFAEAVEREDPDVIVGYNSAGFDFPYLAKRCRALGIKLALGRDKSEVQIKKGGIYPRADIFGRAHVDAFDGVEFLTRIGAMRLPKNTLDAVYFELFKKHKVDLGGKTIADLWDGTRKEQELLRDYNQEDAVAAFEIAKEILPLYTALSKIIGLPLYETSRMATSQMIEWLLIREAHKRGIFVPNRSKEEDVRARMLNPIKGAFVKLPESGLHEGIVVCDFRSLYPSIIIAYNIDQTTMDCDCCKSPTIIPEVGHSVCKEKKGLVPAILAELLEARAKVKAEMKKHKEGSKEYRTLHFHQWGLKILANSAYGYLGFARARWYSREAAESVTALGRHYIHDTIDKAEKAGFHVLYADTDGIFLKLEDKTVEDTKKFVEKINDSLPGKMELEFQGYYPRGIFVTKREGTAAKKRYALIREDGTVEIKGFEFVRSDWANIAKEVQEKVIGAVLREGDPEKAVSIVKKVIKDVRERNVKLEDLIIYTQVTRRVASYAQQAPHVKAAKKLIDAGYKIGPGSVLEFVVVKGAGSISDRSIPVQLLGKKEYDADYYINNQILPAVMKILKELGIKEDNLAFDGEQSGLGKWF
jgi:DNA polymerase I